MSNKSFPSLFKKSSTGAILQWDIGVEGTTIVTAHGQMGGKIQTTTDKIKSGKNAGRKNETAAEEQALKEAQSRWTKKKKSGYVEKISSARSGATDALIAGGALPMLAKVYEEHLSKIKYPLGIQPKLDGHRCVAILDNYGEVTLWTRTRKPITSVPHIVHQLEHMAGKSQNIRDAFPLDGELYNHDLKDDFEKLTSVVRKQKAGVKDHIEAMNHIQYHVYDCMQDMDFMARNSLLADIIILGGKVIELVSTKFVISEEEAGYQFTLHRKLGYEGSMVRLLGVSYENKRSAQLLKVKSFQDAEYEITGVEEGRGKLQGHGIFICTTNGRDTFNVKMAGETSNLKKFWENKDDYIGRMLTVQFQGKTNTGLPRFPVGLRLRDDL